MLDAIAEMKPPLADFYQGGLSCQPKCKSLWTRTLSMKTVCGTWMSLVVANPQITLSGTLVERKIMLTSKLNLQFVLMIAWMPFPAMDTNSARQCALI